MKIRPPIIRAWTGDDGQHPAAPIGTLDANDRYALVEAAAAEWNDIVAAKALRVYRFLVDEGVDGPWLDHEHRVVRIPGTNLVIYDLGMRMLVPRELFRANGFDDDYVIDLRVPGKPNRKTGKATTKPITKTELVRLAGNVVCPAVAAALVRAALSGPALPRARRGEQIRLALEAA